LKIDRSEKIQKKMKNILTFYLLIIVTINGFGQSIDDRFSQKQMSKDLAVFKEIRIKANSGLYKYRSKTQIDSLYNWAENEIKNLTTYREFYNLITILTDYEGSCHNSTLLPKKHQNKLRGEFYGYFPFPIKWINGKWLINFKDGNIPLGSEIVSINDVEISEIINSLEKYSTSDGINKTGKRIDIRTHFAAYYRINYGLIDSFKVEFKTIESIKPQIITLQSVSYQEYYKNFRNLFSKPLDQFYYGKLNENQKYFVTYIDSVTTMLTIRSFSIGNENSIGHKNYLAFLDSTFAKIRNDNIKNLILDIRQNGGGDDPNDVVTYSYLTERNFQENKQAWVSFKKIPLIKYYNIGIPKFIRPFVAPKYNHQIQNLFPLEKDGKYYQDKNNDYNKQRLPNKNAFTGNIFLLIDPAIASAASLFGSMVAGNKNTIVIGEETVGGYYGHNGYNVLEYKLPNSNIITKFFMVNLEQDVIKEEHQYYNRGIIPDIEIIQDYEDFLNNEDTQLKFVKSLINKKKKTNNL